MREIKFRRYSTRVKQYVPDGHNLYTLAVGKPIELLNDDVVEQYTGINDCDGTPIYEGGIVKVINIFSSIQTVNPFVVEPDNYVANKWIAEYVFDLVFDIDDSYVGYELEVIGNIHENHELLEG